MHLSSIGRSRATTHFKSQSRLELFIIALCALCVLSGCDFSGKREFQKLKRLEERVRKNPRDKEAIDEIVAKAHGRSWFIRGNAVGTLGRLAHDFPQLLNTVLPILIHSLETGDQWEQRTAVEQLIELAGITSFAAIPALTKALGAGDVDVAWFSAEALGKYGPVHEVSNAVPALAKALTLPTYPGAQDEAPQLRVFAATSLGRIGASNPKVALTALKQAMASDNPFLSLEAAKAVCLLEPENQDSLAVLQNFTTSSRRYLRDDATWFLKARAQK